jgi:hypothetical protein
MLHQWTEAFQPQDRASFAKRADQTGFGYFRQLPVSRAEGASTFCRMEWYICDPFQVSMLAARRMDATIT